MASRKPRVEGQRGAAAVRAHRAARSERNKNRDNKQQQARSRTQAPRQGPCLAIPKVGQRVAYKNSNGRVVWAKVVGHRDGNCVSRRRGGPQVWIVVSGRHESENVIHVTELKGAKPRKRPRVASSAEPAPPAVQVAPAAPARAPTPSPRTPRKSAPRSRPQSRTPTPPSSQQGRRLLAALKRGRRV